jgi:hypothetical protein
MNPIAAIIRHFRRRKLIELESKVAGLAAKLKRTEILAARCQTPMFDIQAIDLSAELWENKRRLQLLSEQHTTIEK